MSRTPKFSNLDTVEFERAVNFYVECYRSQRTSKTSERNALLKHCLIESWFGYNRPLTVKALSLRANLPECVALRWMHKGVDRGRYVASPRGYVPSFSGAHDVAKFLQTACIPFCLTAGKFYIQCDVAYLKCAADYLLVQQKYTCNLGATAQLLLLHLIKRELVCGLESTATRLSVALSLSKSTASDTLHVLMEKGYVVTTKDIADDRRTLLWLNLSDAHYKALNESFSSVFLQATGSVEVGGREEAS
jgi:hypothetical protein